MYTCFRCRKETKQTFMFFDVDKKSKKRKFGNFCQQCTYDLINDLKGKVEWFYMQNKWKGFLYPEEKESIKQFGFNIRNKTQTIEIIIKT